MSVTESPRDEASLSANPGASSEPDRATASGDNANAGTHGGKGPDAKLGFVGEVRERSAVELVTWAWRGYLRRHLKLLIIATILMSISGGTLGLLSYLVKPMFDRIFVGGESAAVWGVGLAIVFLFAVRALTSVGQSWLMTRISMRVSERLRLDLLDRIVSLDGEFHQSHPPGFLIQRIQGDVQAVNNVWQVILAAAGRDTVALLGLLSVAMLVDWRWTLIALVGVPIMLVPLNFLQKYIRSKAGLNNDLNAALAVRVDEIFHLLIPIKLARLERYQIARYRTCQTECNRAGLRGLVASASIPAMVDILSGCGLFLVILFGGREIVSGEKTLGEFMSFFTAISLTFDPLRRQAALLGQWQVAASSLDRIKTLFETPIRITSPAKPIAPPRGLPEIELRDVHLAYGSAPALDGVTFVAESGKTTALVGMSGAGKSTVFHALTRLVDPQSGEIRAGEMPTKDMDLDDLRGLFSVVTQDALLFDDTLRENVTLGHEVSDAELRAALDAANVSEFLGGLENGIDTSVGPRGSKLSGGQRQRVMIARALLHRKPVLLLDEATSALDAKSERVVQEALDRLVGGHTTLVIAHRLSTIRNADKIVVLHRGRVAEQGTHDDLMKENGIYASLHRLQS